MKNSPNFYPMIDFSYWNTAAEANAPTPTINPELMLEQGIKGVILRAGKGVEGMKSSHGVDSHFLQSASLCREAGMPTMAYWRIYDLWFEPADYQAMRFGGILHEADFDNRAPIWIDCEEYITPGEPANSVLLGRILVHDWIMQFAGAMRAQGFHNIGFYTRKSWWNPNTIVPEINGSMNAYPLWVAHWIDSAVRPLMSTQYKDPNTWDELTDRHFAEGPDVPRDWADWDIWQFVGEGSSLGQEFGFASEHIDCNLIRAEAFHRWFGE